MKIKNFTGFILGNEHNVYRVGMPWMNHNERLWVCPNLAKAKRMLMESQQRLAIEPRSIWTTVYQVSGHDVAFEQAGNGLLYTKTPTQLIIERIVMQKTPDVITEEYLAHNAATIIADLAKTWGK